MVFSFCSKRAQVVTDRQILHETFDEMENIPLEELKVLGLGDLDTFQKLRATASSLKAIDDKAFLMERAIQAICNVPPNSRTREVLMEKFSKIFLEPKGLGKHNPVFHTSPTYLGDRYSYRSADGSHNNPAFPRMGAAKTPYGRFITSLVTQSDDLPDPGLIFDSLFCRKAFIPHPKNISSLFPAWATLIANDTFQTSLINPAVSETSSHLDLSILYGNNEYEQGQMRTFRLGRIKPDCFSYNKILTTSPVAAVLLIMLNRFHNYIVEKLAAINENSRFTQPPEDLSPHEAQVAWAKHDNDLFQTGRLITCGLYINITLYDFLRTATYLNQSNSDWNIDPRYGSKSNRQPVTPGNQSLAELSFIYNWHSMTSAKDESQTESQLTEDLPTGTRPRPDIHPIPENYKKDPFKQGFAGLQSQPDGTFLDEDLVHILSNSIEEVAGFYGAYNTPIEFRDLDIHHIQQARQWNVGSLNDFRRSLGLASYKSFEEITSDKEVSQVLKHLYDHPNLVELYPGIIAEEATRGPANGIAISGTVLHAMLTHIVTTVRNDRVYNSDYNPKILTNWGFSEVQYDLEINQGCIFYKLVQRSFPFHFKSDSIYAHFPMTVPSQSRRVLGELGRKDDYSYDRPRFTGKPLCLESYSSMLNMVKRLDFRLARFDSPQSTFSKGLSSYLHLSIAQSMSEGKPPSERCDVLPEFPHTDVWHSAVKDFYLYTITRLLDGNSNTLAGVFQADISKVLNLAHVYFACEVLPISVKTEDAAHHKYTGHDIYTHTAALFSSAFYDVDPDSSFALQRAAKVISTGFAQEIEPNVRSIASSAFVRNASSLSFERILEKHKFDKIHQLLRKGQTIEEIVWSYVIPMIMAIIPQGGQFGAEIINFYISDEGKKHLPEIRRTALEETAESDRKLFRYSIEALRLCASSRTLYESRGRHAVDYKSHVLTLNSGDKVFPDLERANRDPSIFPNPDDVILNRPMQTYINFGFLPQSRMQEDLMKVALTATLRAVGSLEGLRRCPGEQGMLHRIPSASGFPMYSKDNLGSSFAFPTTLRIHFDAETSTPVGTSLSEVIKQLSFGDNLAGRQFEVSSAIKASHNETLALPFRSFEGHASPMKSIAISSNHQRLACSGTDQQIFVWDIGSGAPKWILHGHPLAITSLAFTADGQRLASTSEDNTVRVWNLNTGETEHPLLYYTGMVSSASFSSDGRRLASGSYDGSVRLLEVGTDTCTTSISTSDEFRVTSVNFSHDGRYLAIGYFDGSVNIWDISKATSASALLTGDLPVLSASFSPCNRFIVTVCVKGVVRLWDFHSAVEARAIFCLSFSTSMVFTADSRKLVTASDTGIVRFWNIWKTSVLMVSSHSVGSGVFVEFTPDARQLVSAYDKTVQFWDTNPGSKVRTIHLETTVTSIAISECGEHIAYGFDDGVVGIWDTILGREIHSLETHDLCVSSVAFSSDGRLISASYDGTVQVWAARTYTPLRTLTGHMDSVTSAVFLPDGLHVITASSDSTIQFWDINAGKKISVLECHSHAVNTLAYAPNGKWLAAASDNGLVHLWNLTTKAEGTVITGGVMSVKSLAFSSDNRQLALGLVDGTVQIRDIEIGADMQALHGHCSPVTSVQFSPDGRRLVAASHEGKVIVWEVGVDTQCLSNHQTSSAVIASLSPDNELYVAASSNSSVQLWKMRPF